MSKEVLAALAKMREDFPPNQISQMCRSTKKDNPKGHCPKCKGYHGLPSIQLDYVGHAALTDRLLDADPAWTWEPLAADAMGYPAIDRDGGMWIKLTIAGVTRLGYGDAQGKTGGDAMKERIGDALRNAAMRFGAALDLWHKGDLHVEEGEGLKKEEEPTPVVPPPPSQGTLSADQQKYFPRVKRALDALFSEDVSAKKAEIKKLTTFPGKDGKEVPGVEDYRKLDGKRLQILCQKLEKQNEEGKREPAICAQCGQPVNSDGKCNAFKDCPNSVGYEADIPF